MITVAILVVLVALLIGWAWYVGADEASHDGRGNGRRSDKEEL